MVHLPIKCEACGKSRMNYLPCVCIPTLTDVEKIQRLRNALHHSLSCFYGGHGCTFPDARADQDIARLLGEPFSHKGLADEEHYRQYG